MDFVNSEKNLKSRPKKEKMEIQELSNDLMEDSKSKTKISSSKTLFIKQKSNPRRKTLIKVAKGFGVFFGFVVIVLAVLGIIYVFLPYQRLNSSLNNIQLNTALILNGFKSKDISNFEQYTKNIQNELTKINSEIDRYDFLKEYDATKGYYDNFQVVRGIVTKSNNLIETSLPQVKDVLKVTGFKVDRDQVLVENTDPNGKKDSAISLVLKEMPEYLKLYDQVEPQIMDILSDLKKINPEFVPAVGGINLKDKLNSAVKFSDDFPTISFKLKNFAKYLPDLLGSKSPARYLLILQNEAEMRSSGGLLTAYGQMSIENGNIETNLSLKDTWNIERYISYTLGIDMGYRNIYGQRYLMNGATSVKSWSCGADYLRAQDIGIYPDLAWTSKVFSEYYNTANKYNAEEYPDYDYIVMINYDFASQILSLIQPVTVEGFGDVNADNLFAFIKNETDSTGKYGLFDENRKEIIQKIMDAIKTKIFDLPAEKIPDFINTVIHTFKAKDISLLSPKNQTIQNYLDEYGFTARTVKDFKGDYFQMGEAQVCAYKINQWLRDAVTQNVYINSDGSYRKNVHTLWTQDKVYDPALEAQYPASDSFSYRAWIRIIAPNGTSGFDSDGYERSNWHFYKPKEYYDEVLDKSVSDNIIQFDHRRFSDSDPIPQQELNVSYSLPSSINYNTDGKYQMLIQKHPGKAWEKYTINIHIGDQTYTTGEFVLDQDKVVTYKDGIISIDNYDKKLDWITELMQKIPLDKLKPGN